MWDYVRDLPHDTALSLVRLYADGTAKPEYTGYRKLMPKRDGHLKLPTVVLSTRQRDRVDAFYARSSVDRAVYAPPAVLLETQIPPEPRRVPRRSRSREQQAAMAKLMAPVARRRDYGSLSTLFPPASTTATSDGDTARSGGSAGGGVSDGGSASSPSPSRRGASSPTRTGGAFPLELETRTPSRRSVSPSPLATSTARGMALGGSNMNSSAALATTPSSHAATGLGTSRHGALPSHRDRSSSPNGGVTARSAVSRRSLKETHLASTGTDHGTAFPLRHTDASPGPGPRSGSVVDIDGTKFPLLLAGAEFDVDCEVVERLREHCLEAYTAAWEDKKKRAAHHKKFRSRVVEPPPARTRPLEPPRQPFDYPE